MKIMSKIILQEIKPSTIEKLKHLAKQHQRSIEEEITAILEDVTENVTKNVPEDEPITTPVNKGWQKGFFEEVIGGWKGEPLTREPQPEQQERDFL